MTDHIQCPKVEKQEKKKTPKGRASESAFSSLKECVRYRRSTRRVCNVVLGDRGVEQYGWGEGQSAESRNGSSGKRAGRYAISRKYDGGRACGAEPAACPCHHFRVQLGADTAHPRRIWCKDRDQSGNQAREEGWVKLAFSPRAIGWSSVASYPVGGTGGRRT
jgi:hypothetical protein